MVNFVKETIAQSEELTAAWESIKAPFIETFEAAKKAAAEFGTTVIDAIKPIITTFAGDMAGIAQERVGTVRVAGANRRRPSIARLQAAVEANKPALDTVASGLSAVFQSLSTGAEEGIGRVHQCGSKCRPVWGSSGREHPASPGGFRVSLW